MVLERWAVGELVGVWCCEFSRSVGQVAGSGTPIFLFSDGTCRFPLLRQQGSMKLISIPETSLHNVTQNLEFNPHFTQSRTAHTSTPNASVRDSVLSLARSVAVWLGLSAPVGDALSSCAASLHFVTRP